MSEQACDGHQHECSVILCEEEGSHLVLDSTFKIHACTEHAQDFWRWGEGAILNTYRLKIRVADKPINFAITFKEA